MGQDGREYILCGDWNIAHKPIDLKNWRSNQKNSGFLPEERAWLDQVFGPSHPRTAKGKTRWRETKVAILAHLGARLTRQGTRVTRLYQRRLVAVLGTIDELAPRLWLKAVCQGVRN